MRLLFLIGFIFCLLPAFSNEPELIFIDSNEVILSEKILELPQGDVIQKKEHPVIKFLARKKLNNKRIIAALLAFPFPFGIVGLHRIYLGTKPYVPVAYIASLGGGVGILPLIDFFVILFDKDFEHYENNGKVLMWVRD